MMCLFENQQFVATLFCLSGQAEIVRVLIEHGARPCLCTGSGWTAAHFAAEAGRLQVLRMLHAFHAPLDKEDCCGDKPVQIAEVYGHIDCVQFLKRYRVLFYH